MKKTTLIYSILCLTFICCIAGPLHAEESPATDMPGQTSEQTLPSDENADQSTSVQNASEGTEETASTGDMQDSKGQIARSQFTTAMQDREPTDDITTLSNDHDKIYFFTDLVDFDGTTITHRWEYQGTIMAEVNFNVGGNRWRVYSSKSLKPEWTGTWSVSVLNAQGTILKTSTFELVTADNTQ